VKVVFNRDNAAKRIQYLHEIYGLLKTKKVPHVDKILDEESLENRDYLLLSPRGLDKTPSTLTEVFDATRCIIQALKVCQNFIKALT
jgi:hypothetical protein